MMRKLALVVLFAFLLLPIYFMLESSFTTAAGTFHMPPEFIPSNPTLDNYALMLSTPWPKWAGNTTLVALATAAASVVVSCMGGYAFAVYQFKGKRVLWSALLIGIMLPRISIIIPLYVVIAKLGISGSLAAVILPCILSPFGLYLARAYFESIPSSLLESARIEGANEWQVLWRIVAPMSAPIVAALFVFGVVGSLQDFIWQALVLQDTANKTLLVGLTQTAMVSGAGVGVAQIGRQLSAGALLFLPLVAIFAATSKYFVADIGGAMKE